MPDPTARLGGELGNQDFDLTKTPTYSDLDYSMIRIYGGLSYDISSDLTYSIKAEYADLTDDKGYVFGVESGSYFMIRSGFKFGL